MAVARTTARADSHAPRPMPGWGEHEAAAAACGVPRVEACPAVLPSSCTSEFEGQSFELWVASVLAGPPCAPASVAAAAAACRYSPAMMATTGIM
eukprot:CAMPEP_0202916112 /NCGR_PEP_ID=MMETSP1392-20130828/67657_1 /ASSEMBLY_ACC=CAM_ASM_000868 /TAXON_ID=225041 /ORGANISM="Chlamydomonas chlamydogama, Strain SAG 11-48b" /LENGTH=94 /DNA_ID=CAMNT_0049608407 /DNA_START=150 /DNA_END=434 /DNA_ORIENTATION=+